MSVESNIEEWILTTLAEPQKIFNHMPICPFAKQAWLDSKVYIKHNQNTDTEEDLVLLDYYEVIVYAYDPDSIDSDSLSAQAQKMCNEEIVALEDHPSQVEEIQGISLNNGVYALILVQQRSKLEQARQVLKAKGYYEKWPASYLNDVLSQ